MNLDKELENLDRIFIEHNYVYIHGREGFGKTTLANKYAERYAQLNPKCCVRYINSKDSLEEFKLLAKDLDIPIINENVINDVKERLHTNVDEETSVFFVLDDFEEDNPHLKILCQGPNFKILITTNSSNLKGSIESSFPMQLEAFDRKKCEELVQLRKPIDQSTELTETEWTDIFERIGAGKADKVVVIPKKLDELLSDFKTNWTYNDVISHLNDIQPEANNYLQIESENAHGFKILTFMSYLKSENKISFDLIKSFVGENDDLDANLIKLVKHGEITKLIFIEENQFYAIDKLAQKEVLKINTENGNEILIKIICTLNSLIKDYYQEDLYEHAVHVLSYEWEGKYDNEDCAELYIKLAILNEIPLQLDYQKCLDFYKVFETYANTTSPYRASALFRLASIEYDLGEFEKALAHLSKAHDIFSATKDSISLAFTLNNIGDVYIQLNNYDLAIKNFEESLRLKKYMFDDTHSSVGTTLNNIGEVLFCQSNWDAALSKFNEALRIKMINFSENHFSIGQIRNNIGLCNFKRKMYAEAILSYEKALKVYENTLDRENSLVAVTRTNLGEVYASQGDGVKAVDNYNKSLQINEKIMPDNHPHIRKTRELLQTASERIRQT